MKMVFTASRFTKGNFWFPQEVTLTETDITFKKKKVIGSEEKTLSYAQIASVVLSTGMMYADVLIESSGGNQIQMTGFTNADAMKMKEILDEGRRRNS